MESSKLKGLLAIVACAGSLATSAEARIEVQGHRGARAQRPENTLPAFQYALEVGVDTLELDLGVTKDNVLVVSHDSSINRQICRGPNGGAQIRSLTLAQVKEYDCGSMRNSSFPEQVPVPGARIPTLDEVIELVKNSPLPAARTVQLNIETKIASGFFNPDAVTPEEFARLVVAAVQRQDFVDRVTIQSFESRSIVEVRRIEPRLRISTLVSNRIGDLAGYLGELRPDVYSPSLNRVTPAAVQTAHAAGARVIAWTANTPDEWEELVASGVDGIISDDPAKLIAWLEQNNQR